MEELENFINKSFKSGNITRYGIALSVIGILVGFYMLSVNAIAGIFMLIAFGLITFFLIPHRYITFYNDFCEIQKSRFSSPQKIFYNQVVDVTQKQNDNADFIVVKGSVSFRFASMNIIQNNGLDGVDIISLFKKIAEHNKTNG